VVWLGRGGEGEHVTDQLREGLVACCTTRVCGRRKSLDYRVIFSFCHVEVGLGLNTRVLLLVGDALRRSQSVRMLG
jgi:hypothetical protein